MLSSFLVASPDISIHRRKRPSNAEWMFSIIIPSWNNLNYLQTCIASLQKNSHFSHQIIIHLNEGKDGSREWVDSQGFDYCYSEINIGICCAINLARHLVATDYLVYFNDDMYACPNWDYWLYEEIKQQKSLFFLLSATMIEHSDTGNECVIAPFNFGTHPDNFKEEELLTQFHLPEKADWQGTTWPPCLLPTLLWDLVGGYSIEFSPGMYSDPDFVMKLWQVGVRHFKGVGKSRVYHFMSASTGKLQHKTKGSHKFLTKWGISTNVFARYYLQRGRTWTKNLTMPTESTSFKCHRLLNKIKRFLI